MMSAKGMESFIEKMRSDDFLADEVAICVTDLARSQGYSFREEDVSAYFLDNATPSRAFSMFINHLKYKPEIAAELHKTISGLALSVGIEVAQNEVEKYISEKPVARPLPGRGGDITTTAMGEEGGGLPPDAMTMAVGEDEFGGFPSVTLAIGEEDRPKRPPGGMTTMAVGEEGGKGFIKLETPTDDDDDDAVSTHMVGEEDGSFQHPDDFEPDTDSGAGDRGGASSMAMGEEGGNPFRGMNFEEIVGKIEEERKRQEELDKKEQDTPKSEDDKPTPPPTRTTMAVGEEGGKPRRPER